MTIFDGVGVALVTLFDADLSVDLEATVELAGELVAEGMRAVVVGGSTGEAYALDNAERTSLITAVREALPADVPVIAGTGAPSARQAAQLTMMAADAGADAALVLSPPRSADVRPYYDVVAQAAGDLPLLAYHFPAASAPGINLAHLRELPVVGLKDSTGDPDRLLEELTTYQGQVYVGSSALLTQAGALGAVGAILALANSQPEDCVAAFAGDAQAQLRLAPHHLSLPPFPQGIKDQVAARWGYPAHSRMG
ncbi:MAG: dihydrodipicolinate synthase family protein [Euzebya sp.]